LSVLSASNACTVEWLKSYQLSCIKGRLGAAIDFKLIERKKIAVLS
jgi:hypothetical protein